MTTMFNTLLTPVSEPVVGAKVEISLTVPDSAPGFVTTGEDSIISTHVTTTGVDGTWTADLIPNADVLTAGSYYTVTERYASSTVTYTIVVPAEAATPVDEWVGDNLYS